MHIRTTEATDYDAIRGVIDAAFEQPDEGRLVETLRAADADSLELVAENDGEITGTILFSPVIARDESGRDYPGLGLAPLAVRPDRQKRGIGAALCETGLDYIRTLGAPYCVVLGEPAYYSRFGFQPASRVNWTWDADPEGRAGDAFQVQTLSNWSLPTEPCQVSYHAAFGNV